MNEITRILEAAQRGEPSSASELLPLVYGELRRFAAHKMAQEAPGHTLQPTALVHEAWLRLVTAEPQAQFQNRAHFFGAPAEAMRLISIYGQESNYTTWRLAKMNLAIRGIDAQGMKGQPRHFAKPRNSESVPTPSSHVFNQTAQNEVFDGLWREAAGDFGGVLAEFLNVHMSELRKGGKDTITGQPQVDDFSALLRSE